MAVADLRGRTTPSGAGVATAGLRRPTAAVSAVSAAGPGGPATDLPAAAAVPADRAVRPTARRVQPAGLPGSVRTTRTVRTAIWAAARRPIRSAAGSIRPTAGPIRAVSAVRRAR